MLSHVNWLGDSLTIEEQGQKADQTGEDKFAKHLYANPLNAAIYPVLVIAVMIFSCSDSSSAVGWSHQQLFAGTDSKGRFSKHLHTAMSKCTEAERLLLGAFIQDLETHSLRKGSGAYCLDRVIITSHLPGKE